MNVLTFVPIAIFELLLVNIRGQVFPKHGWQILQSLQRKNVCEILILSGEIHPQSPQRQFW
ncbi:MAG: hypothetical protein KPI85_00025 [cyanobacterium endosymbiont of Epithemia adnata isolate EadnSB Bon19]|jgi:hypothetical protein